MVGVDDHDANPARALMGWIHSVLRSNKHPHRSRTSASAERSGRATHRPANRAHDSLQRDIIGIHLVAYCRFTGFRFSLRAKVHGRCRWVVCRVAGWMAEESW